jgi:hypothetical protein
MLANPPLSPTDLTPEDIIGFNNMETFASHCKEYRRLTGEGKQPKENSQMAEILRRLREHGYMPGAVDSRGGMKFVTILKSKVQQLFEGPELDEIKKMTFSQMQEKARGNFVNIAADRHWTEVDEDDVEREAAYV